MKRELRPEMFIWRV